MLKLVALFNIKPGMTRKACIDYYETRHVPLIAETMPDFFKDHRRNFVLPDSMYVPGHVEGPPPPPPFDMMTELWFESQAKYDAMTTIMADPAVGERVARDEANFLDRSSMIMFMVDERGRP